MFAFYKHKRFYWLCQSRNFWHRYCLCCVVVTSSGGATFKLYIRLRVILLPGLLGKNIKKNLYCHFKNGSAPRVWVRKYEKEVRAAKRMKLPVPVSVRPDWAVLHLPADPSFCSAGNQGNRRLSPTGEGGGGDEAADFCLNTFKYIY